MDRASLVVQMVKNLPAMWETWVRPLGGEDPLEKGKATHSSILAWRSLWTEKPGNYNPWGCKESDTTDRLSLSLVNKRVLLYGRVSSDGFTANHISYFSNIKSRLLGEYTINLFWTFSFLWSSTFAKVWPSMVSTEFYVKSLETDFWVRCHILI